MFVIALVLYFCLFYFRVLSITFLLPGTTAIICLNLVNNLLPPYKYHNYVVSIKANHLDQYYINMHFNGYRNRYYYK